MGQELTVQNLEKAYRDALARFKADKTNKDLRRARTAAKRAWDEAVAKESADSGAQQLRCSDCSQMFLWTAEEQDYYKDSERNWGHKPQRCRKCAESQKDRRKSHHLLRCELATETNEETKILIVRKLGRAGKNMCYAFQRGECKYGDLCKFNHDPEFGGKKKDNDSESENKTDETEGETNVVTKKRKVIPDVIAICKWGKDCKIKRCRYRHAVGNSDRASPQSVPTTKAIHQENSDATTKSNIIVASTNVSCIQVPSTDVVATTTKEKPKVIGICKWGKNCKIKRCRFEHPDVPSSPSTSLPLKQNQKDSSVSTVTAPINATETPEKAAASSTFIDGTKENDNGKTKSKPKAKSKSSNKLVHKAMRKALKKAPNHKLRVKDLRKLLRKKMEAIGKDEIKLFVGEAIANHKESMTLLDGGTFVKLLV